MDRRLAAILAADVVGYSRLMDADEEGVLVRLKAHRNKITDPAIARHKGRIVKLMGDGMLAEFASVVDAVRCAVDIQEAMREYGADLAEDQRIRLRIGINLGDVIIDGEDIYGDGVNIAARLEGLAEVGGICVSGTVFDQVRNKVGLEFEDLGERQVKNIPQPLRVYRIAAETAGECKRTNTFEASIGLDFAVPEYPSIAVLPFTVMNADPEQEFFADGVTEDIITTLSKISNLLVVAGSSTSTYKGNPVDVKQVSREQGVRYVLEGSVRKAGGRVRVNAQLIEAATGSHLWAERYDRDLDDIFAVQDEITREVVVALDVRLREGEQQRVWSRGTGSFEAWECVRLGAEQIMLATAEHRLEARRLFERALELDPRYATAWAMLGWVHYMDADVATGIGNRQRMEASLQTAREYGERALEFDPSCADAFAQIAMCQLAAKSFDEAIEMAERAVTMVPNNSENLATAALVMNKSGKPERGLELIKKAMRLCPLYRTGFLDRLGMAYRLLGQPEAAISAYRQSLKRQPEFLSPHVNLTSIFGELGRLEDAHKAAREVLRLEPNFSVKAYMGGLSYRNPSDLERIAEGLRQSGLPE